ncbi:MAG: hypothetical protein L7U72_09460, partial [Rubripirellula sp.]|nr:hypothetical protein [Rubripirellula sp.]
MITPEILNLAYDWLCKQRRQAHHNHCVWHLRWNWDQFRPQLLKQLREGTYRLSPTRMVRIDGEAFEVWCSTDSLVLKAVSIVLSRQWHGLLSKRCFHLTGRGGSKAAVREVLDKIHPVSTSPESGSNQTAARFVFKSDVKRYYASMDHEILIDQCRELIDDETIFDLVRQYIRRC